MTGMPITRVRCKPPSDGGIPAPLLAATYASGHLRVWNHGTGTMVAQVSL